MHPIAQISLAFLGWLVALSHGRAALLNRAWKTDPIALRIGLASLFFALTLTFLITPISNVINHLTAPNLSRLLAYLLVSTSLYLITSSSLISSPALRHMSVQRFLGPHLIVTLGLLLFSYVFFVSHTPEWIEGPIPGSAAEMAFKLVLDTYAIVLCGIIAAANYHSINREKVIVTKYRLAIICVTAIFAGAFIITKTISTLAYLWHPLGAEWLRRFSELLMIATAILWGGSFLHSNVYAQALAISRGVRYWFTYRDLVALAERLEHLCPPVGMELSKPNFWQFVHNSDYHLYRALVHILDGKTLISDFLDDAIPLNKSYARWDQNGYLEATRLNAVLRKIKADEDYLEMISVYRSAGKKLMQAHG